MTRYRYFLLSSVLQFPYSFNVQQYRFFFAPPPPSPRLCPHFAHLHRKSCHRPCCHGGKRTPPCFCDWQWQSLIIDVGLFKDDGLLPPSVLQSRIKQWASATAGVSRRCWQFDVSDNGVYIFNVKKYRDLEIPVKGQSRSLKVVPIDILGMVSY